jgi:hypothetical protein
MRRLAFTFALFMTCAASALAQSTGTAATLDKAGLAPEVKNDQREMVVPPAGQQFLWVTGTITGPKVIVDLSKVTLVSAAGTVPLIGVDSAFGGDPTQFSMIAKVQQTGGGLMDPLEETRSVGGIGFAFTPGKEASLKVNMPPQSFCLLFAVAKGFKGGVVHGLGPSPLPVPAPK